MPSLGIPMTTTSTQTGARATEQAARIFSGIPTAQRTEARARLLSRDPQEFAPYLERMPGSNLFVGLVRDRLLTLLGTGDEDMNAGTAT